MLQKGINEMHISVNVCIYIFNDANACTYVYCDECCVIFVMSLLMSVLHTDCDDKQGKSF